MRIKSLYTIVVVASMSTVFSLLALSGYGYQGQASEEQFINEIQNKEVRLVGPDVIEIKGNGRWPAQIRKEGVARVDPPFLCPETGNYYAIERDIPQWERDWINLTLLRLWELVGYEARVVQPGDMLGVLVQSFIPSGMNYLWYRKQVQLANELPDHNLIKAGDTLRFPVFVKKVATTIYATPDLR